MNRGQSAYEDSVRKRSSIGQSRGWLAWLIVPLPILAGIVICRVWTSQYADGAGLYFLSTASEVLAAVLAMTVAIPLAFAASSRALSGAPYFIVRSRVFLGYVLVFVLTTMYLLFLFRYRCASAVMLDIGLIATLACLATVLPYALWVERRTWPLRNIGEIFSRVRRAAVKTDDAHSRSEFDQLLSVALASAAQGATTGVQDDMQQVFGELVLLVHDSSKYQEWARRASLDATRALLDAHALNPIVAYGFADALIDGCLSGNLKDYDSVCRLVDPLRDVLGRYVVQGAAATEALMAALFVMRVTVAQPNRRHQRNAFLGVLVDTAAMSSSAGLLQRGYDRACRKVTAVVLPPAKRNQLRAHLTYVLTRAHAALHSRRVLWRS